VTNGTFVIALKGQNKTPGYTYKALSGQNAKYQSPVDDFDEFLSAEG
jgi:hypothetical protein